MLLTKDSAPRLMSERMRLGYSSAQAAVLGGVEAEAYSKMEDGTLYIPIELIWRLQKIGFRGEFIHMGEESASIHNDEFPTIKEFHATSEGHYDNGGFAQAVRLMRRSVAAVDAFLGEGLSTKSPELVAALMNASISLDQDLGAGEREELVSKVENALQSLAEAISDAGEQIAHSIAPEV